MHVLGVATRERGLMMRLTNQYIGPAHGTGNLSRPVRELLARTGGIVSTRELRAVGVDPTMIELYRDFHALQAVRQGWHCHPNVSALVRLAWRFGGPLACISALEFHEGGHTEHGVRHDGSTAPLHVSVPTNARDLPSPALLAQRWGIELPLEPIVHWSTRDHASGDRQAVSRTTALRQADRCKAL